MKLLFIYSSSCGLHSYIFQALDSIRPEDMMIDTIHISQYGKADDSGYDYLIYNSFAYEGNPKKFDREMISVTDEKFHKFKGKKLLFDTYDDGNKDGFERFADYDTPRMKITPGYEFMKEFKVIIPIPFTVLGRFVSSETDVKNIPLIYCVSLNGYPHDIRRMVFERLKPFNPYTKRHSSWDYAKVLRSAKISVAVPGWGVGCKSHVETLSAGTLLFAYDSIKTVKTLPFGEMMDGHNYVSFNLDNFEERLSEIMKNEDRIKFISENGKMWFHNGYSPKKTGEQILDYFRKES